MILTAESGFAASRSRGIVREACLLFEAARPASRRRSRQLHGSARACRPTWIAERCLRLAKLLARLLTRPLESSSSEAHQHFASEFTRVFPRESLQSTRSRSFAAASCRQREYAGLVRKPMPVVPVSTCSYKRTASVNPSSGGSLGCRYRRRNVRADIGDRYAIRRFDGHYRRHQSWPGRAPFHARTRGSRAQPATPQLPAPLKATKSVDPPRFHASPPATIARDHIIPGARSIVVIGRHATG